MSDYKTYEEMIQEHIGVLRDAGLDVEKLDTSGKWVRCNEIGGKVRRKGHLIYKTYSKQLNKKEGKPELYGLSTIYGKSGSKDFSNYQSFGLPSGVNVPLTHVVSMKNDQGLTKENIKASNSAFGFWQHCSTKGKSEYLERKQVGAYGIRYRVTREFGEVAVVPMVDASGWQRGYQILRNDGVKAFARGIRLQGLRHVLKPARGTEIIAIAEGYVTAATILELTGLPTICAFTAENLIHVVASLINSTSPSHLRSPLITIFADNDRHLPGNVGLTKAEEARSIAPESIHVVAPFFDDIPAGKDASDWNDLVRLRGREFTKNQIKQKMESVHNCM